MKSSVLLLPTAAASLYPSYIGLSIELIGFPQWAGTKSKPNEFSNNLINNLVHAQNEHLVVRVGGNSADRAILDKTLTTPTASSCPNADPGAYQCIGTSFFDSYGAFPAGTIYSHNFNLATWNSSGFETLKESVPLACKALKGQLMAWEMGNEPDLYTGKRRPNDYSIEQYLSEWFNATDRFQAYLQDACPDMANDVKYIFPSVSSPGSRLHAPDMFAQGGDKLRAVSQISVHNYMGGATQPGVTLQSTLMNHTAVERSIGGHVNYAKAISASSGADYTIGEQNSLYGGGAAGLSDVFGAALWGMDFALYAASTGVIKRVHFHQSIGSPYAAWAPGAAEPATKPPYYGQLAAATFLANSAQLDVKTLQLGEKDFDSGYAAYKRGRLVRLAAINLREFDGGDGKQRGNKTYTVNVRPFSRWTVKRLSAQSAKAQTGITFNGLAYEAASVGKGVRVARRECDQVAWADARGRLTFSVADSEAVVLV